VGRFRHLADSAAPAVEYVGGASANGTVLVAGHGFGPGTRVAFGTTPASSVGVLATGLLTAVAPAGSDPCQITVTTPAGSATGTCTP
jgi:hypothetical protein